MPNLFGVDFRNLFATQLGGKLLDVTVGIRTATAVDANDPGAPSYSIVNYPAKGIVEVKETSDDGDLVLVTVADATVLLGTLPAGIHPVKGSKLTFIVPGTSASQTMIATETSYDPAGAAVLMKLRL